MAQFLKGALPTPRHRLAAAVPYRVAGATPAQWIVIPQKLSYWLNNVDGCCVSSEEAFCKACSGIFVNDSTVRSWATAHGVMNGAYLDQVLDWMATGGFSQDGNVYNDGHKTSVDWTNAAALNNAIYAGPVKIGVAAGQLERVPGIGGRNGWVATGFAPDQRLDHCVSLCGFGSLSWLASQLKVNLPAGVDGSKPGYALFTWDGIGIIDAPSMVAITGEAWSRSPNTVTVGSNPPTPDVVWTPTPTPTPPSPPSPPSPPPPVPTPSLFSQTFNVAVRKGATFWGIAPVAIPKGSKLTVYAPSAAGEGEPAPAADLLGVVDWQALLRTLEDLVKRFGPAAKPLILALVQASGLPESVKAALLAAVGLLLPGEMAVG